MNNFVTDEVFVKATITEPVFVKKKTDDEIRHIMIERAKILIDEIKRHCDEFDYLSYEVNGHYECSFCGFRVHEDEWECCDDAIEEQKRHEST